MANAKMKYRISATIDADRFEAVLGVICVDNAEPNIQVQQIPDATIERDIARLVRQIPAKAPE